MNIEVWKSSANSDEVNHTAPSFIHFALLYLDDDCNFFFSCLVLWLARLFCFLFMPFDAFCPILFPLSFTFDSLIKHEMRCSWLYRMNRIDLRICIACTVLIIIIWNANFQWIVPVFFLLLLLLSFRHPVFCLLPFVFIALCISYLDSCLATPYLAHQMLAHALNSHGTRTEKQIESHFSLCFHVPFFSSSSASLSHHLSRFINNFLLTLYVENSENGKRWTMKTKRF